MIIVGNGTLITQDPQAPVIHGGAVALGEDGRIAGRGSLEEMKKNFPGAQFVDAHGGVIMPGLINMHHHIYSAFARGLALKGYSPKGFLDILSGLWWRLDRALTLEDTYQSALVTYLDCIRNGVTTVFDHHASYGAVAGSLGQISRAAEELGVRTCLCYEVSDRDGADLCRQAIEENAGFIAACARRTDDMQHGMMGMHAAFTLSDVTLDACVERLPADVGCHIHVAEGMDDVTHSEQTYGRSVVRRLFEHGVLGPKTIAAHSIHLNEEDIALLRQTGTMVVHNPESNMSNAVGCADIPAYCRAGLAMGLGTDGYTSDMLESYKAANVLAKHTTRDATAGTGEVTQMLFAGNAALAGRYFKTPLGVLKEGAAADVIVLDYLPFTPLTADNAAGHILFGMSGKNVITTIVNGKVLMQDREFKVADEARLIAGACRQAADFWERVNR